MANEQATVEEAQSQAEQHMNGSNGRKTILGVAALAAASGATAFAAKKAFSSRSDAGSGEGRGRSSGEESLFSSMLESGWDSARDTLLPVAEEAATGAGEFVANHAPEVVRESLVPKFISGFESAKKKQSSEDT
jgi:hypothetical protein